MAAPSYSVVVAGGGTAGHIEPALAVADAMQSRGDIRITALGTAKGLETQLVPERGYDLRLIDPVPVPRKFSIDLFKLPFRVAKAVNQTRKILREVEADALIGFGGYVSAPAYLAARALRIPFYVHEANAKAGMANKLGIRLGATGFNAVADSGIPGKVVGVPIRAGMQGQNAAADRKRGLEKWNLQADKPILLVTGGSQGAQSINTAITGALRPLLDAGFQILHAYGAKNAAPAALEGYIPVPFIKDMAAAYAVADFIICRSGAMTVAEVTAAGIPALYIPLPHGNGEQGLNAASAVAAGAALLISDEALSATLLIDTVCDIFENPAQYEQMKKAVAKAQDNKAATVIASQIINDIKAASHD
ncbi:undecaprenyldiphospho-muramoylpentapeptide beta-N-acetylglucosaminyltransferase [Corynebacterium caspium]|uniref:undecaprenyldiphospho-muramoylpentapeptide beta-N-acetylglucosaminyltransferase n=1 Tax=Corynebacterium caspium TaxID=234828 RepID=UPI0003735DB7|nr:undecaprenyldiphospho-muramoylpentapeptide beta-N-acetylglucosaminyltransferase [Corynebacterium caspium]WKD58996.1 UDP-N-acetylglucosamine--N-acetylmuramyl-(pentapeptide) pyrophosphoryl-undecaprenol N-acetylglucosamine transferase [Corynebacterium caspium DSM 44850]